MKLIPLLVLGTFLTSCSSQEPDKPLKIVSVKKYLYKVKNDLKEGPYSTGSIDICFDRVLKKEDFVMDEHYSHEISVTFKLSDDRHQEVRNWRFDPLSPEGFIDDQGLPGACYSIYKTPYFFKDKDRNPFVKPAHYGDYSINSTFIKGAIKNVSVTYSWIDKTRNDTERTVMDTFKRNRM
jgi:hypothetical protein